jgi:hypothetical protein
VLTDLIGVEVAVVGSRLGLNVCRGDVFVNGMKGTDNDVKGTDNAVKGTDNDVKGTDNGEVFADGMMSRAASALAASA